MNSKKKKILCEKTVTLAGNPNVGKSTLFNALTGMHQHTGNWAGKTVSNAVGYHSFADTRYKFIDIPGTYSLFSQSKDEEVARDFICFEESDATVVVCDATCLERNLNLVLQVLEVTTKVVVCVNLLDEAKRKNFYVDLEKMSLLLGVKVVGVTARSKKGLKELMSAIDDVAKGRFTSKPIVPKYKKEIETAVYELQPKLEGLENRVNLRWLALRLLDSEKSFLSKLKQKLSFDPLSDPELADAVKTAKTKLQSDGFDAKRITDSVTSAIVNLAETIAKQVVKKGKDKSGLDRKIDKIVTGKYTAIPIMLLLLGLVFWITIVGANYPSELLSKFFLSLEGHLVSFFNFCHFPPFLTEMLVFGVYRVVTWVVAVMLPPMAIFFPLFTLLEDSGFLPRVAFNLDGVYKKCKACGRQSLTMCMGFGCNAAGVVGCRIIDSPRERIIAILTNNFVPCNGRFPTLIAVITIFFVTAASVFSSVSSAILLLLTVTLGILMTFFVSKLLSETLLKGIPSSFTLELPPYRPPQLSKVIFRSLYERTIFVLGRAISVAAPAGLIIWLLANIEIGSQTIMAHCRNFLDPFGRFIGLDGAIILAFILGFPANEIVLPAALMIYTSGGTLTEYASYAELQSILLSNGWNKVTAICMILMVLFHFPCSTTVLTIKKETGSLKWTAVSVILPTLIGIILCFLVSSVSRLFI